MHALVPAMTRDHWTLLKEQARTARASGLLPETIRTDEQAIIIAQKGAELGLPPLYALSNIGVIRGKPVCSAELMLALIYRDQGNEAVKFPKTDETEAVCLYKRRGWHKAERYSFSMADAQRAGINVGASWQKYPQAMLRARCISAVARMAFPDSIAGCYTPEELGAQTEVDDEGAVVLAAAPAPAAPQVDDQDAVDDAYDQIATLRRRLHKRFGILEPEPPGGLALPTLRARVAELTALGQQHEREQEERTSLQTDVAVLHERLRLLEPEAALGTPDTLDELRAYLPQLRHAVAALEAGAAAEEAAATSAGEARRSPVLS